MSLNPLLKIVENKGLAPSPAVKPKLAPKPKPTSFISDVVDKASGSSPAKRRVTPGTVENDEAFAERVFARGSKQLKMFTDVMRLIRADQNLTGARGDKARERAIKAIQEGKTDGIRSYIAARTAQVDERVRRNDRQRDIEIAKQDGLTEDEFNKSFEGELPIDRFFAKGQPGIANDNDAELKLRFLSSLLNQPVSIGRVLATGDDRQSSELGALGGLEELANFGLPLLIPGGAGTKATSLGASVGAREALGPIGKLLVGRGLSSASGVVRASTAGRVFAKSLVLDAPSLAIAVKDAGGIDKFAEGMAQSIGAGFAPDASPAELVNSVAMSLAAVIGGASLGIRGVQKVRARLKGVVPDHVLARAEEISAIRDPEAKADAIEDFVREPNISPEDVSIVRGIELTNPRQKQAKDIIDPNKFDDADANDVGQGVDIVGLARVARAGSEKLATVPRQKTEALLNEAKQTRAELESSLSKASRRAQKRDAKSKGEPTISFAEQSKLRFNLDRDIAAMEKALANGDALPEHVEQVRKSTRAAAQAILDAPNDVSSERPAVISDKTGSSDTVTQIEQSAIPTDSDVVPQSSKKPDSVVPKPKPIVKPRANPVSKKVKRPSRLLVVKSAEGPQSKVSDLAAKAANPVKETPATKPVSEPPPVRVTQDQPTPKQSVPEAETSGVGKRFKTPEGFEFEEAELPTNRIGVKDGLQFKRKGITDSTNNTTNQFDDVTAFDRSAAGRVSVWEDKDGNFWVMNGHHRRKIAIQTGTKTLPVSIFREADGVTLNQARALGALQNIKDGKGAAVDAAAVIRDLGIDGPKLKEFGISLKRGVGRDALALSRLPENARDLVENGKVKEEVAARIAEIITDDNVRLDAAVRRAENLNTRGEAEAHAYNVLRKPKKVIEEGNLFDDVKEDVAWDEAAKIASQAIKIISGDSKAFRRLVGAPEAGSTKIDTTAQLDASARESIAAKFVFDDLELDKIINEESLKYAENTTQGQLSASVKRVVEAAREKANRVDGSGPEDARVIRESAQSQPEAKVTRTSADAVADLKQAAQDFKNAGGVKGVRPKGGKRGGFIYLPQLSPAQMDALTRIAKASIEVVGLKRKEVVESILKAIGGRSPMHVGMANEIFTKLEAEGRSRPKSLSEVIDAPKLTRNQAQAQETAKPVADGKPVFQSAQDPADRLRAELGIAPVSRGGRKLPDVVESPKTKEVAEQGAAFARNWQANPRPISAEETVGMAAAIVDSQAALKAAQLKHQELVEAGNIDEAVRVAEEVDRHLGDLADLTFAVTKTGSEWGMSGLARQMELRRGGTKESLMFRLNRAKRGTKATSKEIDTALKIGQKFEDIEAEVQRRVNQIMKDKIDIPRRLGRTTGTRFPGVKKTVFSEEMFQSAITKGCK